MFMQATPPPDEAAGKAEQQALLKQDLIEMFARVNTNVTAESFARDFAESEAESRRMEEQLNSPVTNPSLAPTDCSIGAWDGNTILDPQSEYSEINKVPERPQDMLRSEDIEREEYEVTAEETNEPLTLGHYNAEENEFIVNHFTFSQETIDEINKNASKEITAEQLDSMCNGTFQKLIVAIHENTHRKHNIYDGMNMLGDTPENAIKENRLTETTAKAAEYLAIAQLYTSLKEQGVEQLEIDGAVKPLESMLDYCPNLREAIEKDGFDANNPQSVRNVVEAASDYWHKTFEQAYEEQHADAAKQNMEERVPFATRLRTSREAPEERYLQTSERMLQNIYIGSNTRVDLTHCRDLLDTMGNEDAKELMKRNNIKPKPKPSKEMLEAVDKYLEKRGAKTDEEKQTLLQEEFVKITHRDKDADQELKNIMLGNGGSIRYANGLVETRLPDSNLAIISRGDGQTFVLNSFIDFSPKKSNANENENTGTKANEGNTAQPQLNRQQLNHMMSSRLSR